MLKSGNYYLEIIFFSEKNIMYPDVTDDYQLFNSVFAMSTIITSLNLRIRIQCSPHKQQIKSRVASNYIQ